MSQPLVPNPWVDIPANTFKSKSQEPSEVIRKLRILTANDIPFQIPLPGPDELDSTDPLDSLMTAFAHVVKQNKTDFTEELKLSIHLATGTRTEFCE